MIPEARRGSLLPALAAPGEDVPRVVLPCGLALFVVDEKTIGRAELGTWGVSVQAAWGGGKRHLLYPVGGGGGRGLRKRRRLLARPGAGPGHVHRAQLSFRPPRHLYH